VPPAGKSSSRSGRPRSTLARRRSGPGAAESFPATFPSGEGSDLAGVVTSLGDGVTGFAVGDEVLGWSWRRSSHADYVAVPVAQADSKAIPVELGVAGSLYVVGCTAYAAVRASARSGRDGGGVRGSRWGGERRRPAAADQGATVLAIASERNHDWLRDKGAIPVSYGAGLAERLRGRPRTASTPSSISSGRTTCNWPSISAWNPTGSRPSSRSRRHMSSGRRRPEA